MKIVKWLFLGVSAFLFLVAMFLPAIITDYGINTGFTILQMGFLGIFAGTFAWLANIFGPIAFVTALKSKYKAGFILSGIAFIIALQSFTFTSYPKDESGSSAVITVQYLGSGFYVWELSFLIIFVYCLIQFFIVRKTTKL